MSQFSETIAALSTPAGTAALAVVRASGPACAAVFRGIFGRSPIARLATHGDYRALGGGVLDDVVAVFFAGPRSYTGEDTLEISCHGNPLIAQKVLEDLFARGCTLAQPGEFTRRAFVNGRLDLSQAEAVVDLIAARSERALAAANQQLRGSLGRRLAALTEQLLGALAHIEAYIDFPDEDLPAEDRSAVQAAIEAVARGTGQLLATQHYGVLLREGIRTVILGEPNAGKSSLLNRLVGEDRALVSPEPGTTRDFIEERINLGAHCLRLIDTAGLNPNPGAVEELGIRKTLERAAEADLFLWVLDPRRPLPELPPAVQERINPDNTVIVLNKSDLGIGVGHPELKARLEALPYPRRVSVSALTGDGIEALQESIGALAERFRGDFGDEVVAVNARHAEALLRARTCLAEALGMLARGGSVELIASELRGCLDAFGEIGGRIDNERMLDHLFASFCIGK